MPTHPFAPPAGRLERLTLDSVALRGNLLDDPHVRVVEIYLPPGYDRSSEPYPLLVELAAFTGSGLKRVGWRAFGESVPQRVDRLVAEGRMKPAILAFPDAFTSLGGNQYVDSAATGRWATFLVEELVPEIERRYRVRRGPRHRAVLGKSSGGYGALVQGMLHGDRWGAIACHSGDIGFERVYGRDLPLLADALAEHDGRPQRMVERLREARSLSGRQMHALMLLAMAASYDPDPAAPLGIRVPVDFRTAERDPERWASWLRHDPLTLVERPDCQARLRALAGIFIDCGTRDEYFLHYGARRLSRRLTELDIAHRHEEFDDGHSGIDYRLDVSLPFLSAALEPD